MAYSKQTIDEAFTAYLQCRTAEGTAKLCNVPVVTVRKWRKKYDWDRKLEEEKKRIAEDPFGVNTQLEVFVEKTLLMQEDADVLRQIKMIEGVCWACMREDVPKEQIHLKPRSFKEATDVLLKCFKAREELLHRDKKASVNVYGGNTKMDFITQERNENPSNPRPQMVPRQVPDCEPD